MAMIKCPECGNSISDRAPTCPHCGVPIADATAPAPAPEKAKPAQNEQFDNMIMLARRAKESNNSENAAKYYEMALLANPMDWESSFYQVYYKSKSCVIRDISSAAQDVANCIDNAFLLIGKSDLSDEEKSKARRGIYADCVVLVTQLATAAQNHYNSYSTVSGAFQEYANRVVCSQNIYQSLLKAFEDHCPDDEKSIANVAETRSQFIVAYQKAFNVGWANSVFEADAPKILKVKSSYETPHFDASTSGGCCYVATAIYGSYDCPQVWVLRRYRDDTLAKTWYGRAFIRTYYAVSPKLLQWFGETDWFKGIFRHKLDKMTANLQSKGVECTPYDDKQW